MYLLFSTAQSGKITLLIIMIGNNFIVIGGQFSKNVNKTQVGPDLYQAQAQLERLSLIVDLLVVLSMPNSSFLNGGHKKSEFNFNF